jgi:hypothetical protein
VTGGEIFSGLLILLTLFFVGASCLVRPETIQSRALNLNAKLWPRPNRLFEWMKMTGCVANLRVTGACLVIVAMLLMTIFMEKWFGSWFR